MKVTHHAQRLLFIGPLPPPLTGQSLACEVLLKALEGHYDVELLDINKTDLKSGNASWSRVAEILGVIRRVRQARSRADIIYFTITESLLGNIKDMMIYVACMPKLGRLVIHLHGGAGMSRLLGGSPGLLRVLNGWFLRRMGAVIVLGGRLRGIYAGLVDDVRLKEVQNFAQDDFFLSDAEIENKYRDVKIIDVLYLSNMIPEKGCFLMLDAFKALGQRERAMLRLNFAGGFVSPEDEAAFRAAMADEENVAYHGIVQGAAKRQLLGQSHLLCLPTYYPYEGQPICILEAYAAGSGVITTDHSGILDVFTNDENGLLVEKQSRDDLVRIFRAVLADRLALSRYGRTNAAYARRQFTTDRYNRQLLKILDDVTQQSL
jgi:glycosyltransferase involved in cell wall biosynthesis